MMKTDTTYVGFDFDNVWEIKSGAYPTLKNNPYTYITNFFKNRLYASLDTFSLGAV